MRGLSFSWKRAIGFSAAKARLSRQIGIPLSQGARERKVGAFVLRLLARLLTLRR